MTWNRWDEAGAADVTKHFYSRQSQPLQIDDLFMNAPSLRNASNVHRQRTKNKGGRPSERERQDHHAAQMIQRYESANGTKIWEEIYAEYRKETGLLVTDTTLKRWVRHRRRRNA